MDVDGQRDGARLAGRRNTRRNRRPGPQPGRGHGLLTRTAALLGTVLLLTLFGGTGTASAHAVLTGSTPEDGSVVADAPKTVTLTFSESVGLLDDSFRVLDHTNRRLHTGRPKHADGRSDTASVTLPDGMAKGTFTVGWRVVSADSHPVSGAFTFSVGEPSPTAATLPDDPAANGASTTLYDIARYFAYGGLALLIGVLAFAVATGLEPARRPALMGWWTLLGSTVALFLLRGPYERGTGPGDALDPALLGGTAAGRPGLALLTRLLLLALTVFFPLRPVAGAPFKERLRLAGAGLLAVAFALTWVVSEHAAAGIQVPVAMTSAVLHLLAMAVWLGGLTVLLAALYRPSGELPVPAVARFSRLAFVSVVVLVVTGVYQSWRGLGSFGALSATAYGRLLTAKLCAVVVLLAAAAYSRRFTARLAAPQRAGTREEPEEERTPEPVGAPARTEAGTAVRASETRLAGSPDSRGYSHMESSPGDPSGPDGSGSPGAGGPDRSGGPDRTGGTPPVPADRRRLRASVLTEVTVGIVVLVVTTLLTGTQPGRAATEAAAVRTASGPTLGASATVPFDLGASGGRGKVQIDLTPGRSGENTVQAVVFGPDGGITTVPEVRLTFTLSGQNLGPLDARLENKGGYWGSDTLNLPLTGVWTMKVTVRTTDIDQATVSKRIRVG